MRRLNDLYEDDQKEKPWEKGKFPGPYRPKGTMIVIAGPGIEDEDLVDEDDLGDENDPGPTMPDGEDDMVKISRKEYEDLCKRAGI